ncbi:1-aminocyclopropane-1-carboxylate oxidase-like [Oryza brachyantha]|uniref:1-aminocyclopropane-1-carboxylate oxidase-like n=1 Tax=Oryza brachyantha TaxID=4533 RepID=UPI001ADB30EB|nr:1-aminocyclopropane-1-carboxylate oxidase-like [Oryza brachyantha]
MGKREHMSSKNADALPVVDLAPFLVAAGGDGGVSRATEAVRAACWEYGFFRVVNHGVPPELTARVLELSAVFFALPDEEKAKVRPVEGSGAPLPAGYARQPAHSADKNEYLLVFDPQLGFNLYPDEPTGFREALDECFGKLTQLGVLIQEILNESMGLPPGFLKEYNGDRSFDFMASLRYSPATAEENNGISEHEDSNCITFVLQDGAGGLEVLKDGVWVPADPVEGSIIVNLGDVIQVLTNGKMKSATHRVVRKPAVHRHSLAFFFNVHGDRWVEPLPEYTEKIGEAPRYRRFLYSEYQQLRMRNKTHPPARPEDVVNITHYAI